tara:strand:- start:59 stop:421 length:363 start_codon:yes stop_codon:yes gene_type:complete
MEQLLAFLVGSVSTLVLIGLIKYIISVKININLQDRVEELEEELESAYDEMIETSDRIEELEDSISAAVTMVDNLEEDKNNETLAIWERIEELEDKVNDPCDTYDIKDTIKSLKKLLKNI